MPPVVSALLAFVGPLFRSRISLHLEPLALRHQLAVYQPTVHRYGSTPRIACSGHGSRVSGLAGKAPWPSSSPVRSSRGSSSGSVTTGGG
jgi:hypothetical protein